MPEIFHFSQDFQDLILSSLIKHPSKFLAYGNIIDPRYFQGVHATSACRAALKYYRSNNKFPTWRTLQELVADEAKRIESSPKEVQDYVVRLSKINTGDVDYVVTKVVDFCRERAVLSAVRTAIEHVQAGKLLEGGLVKLFDQALQIGMNLDDLGYRFTQDADAVIDKVTEKTYGIKTGYKHFDAIWKRGWGPGWLIVPLAPPKRFKCLGKGTKVIMYDGSTRKVEDLKVGDLLMGDDSTPRRIETCGKGYGKLFQVKQSNGLDYVCNDVHILCLRSPYKPGKVKEVEAEEYYRESQSKNSNAKAWQGYKVGVDFPQQPVPLDPYFLGLWLGDRNSRESEIAVSSQDKEIGENLIKNKHIPSKFRINSREVRLKLLAGLLDSGGTFAEKVGFVFQNSNHQLIQDVEWLARSLGFRARTLTHKMSIKSISCAGTSQRVIISGDISEIPTLLPRKKGKNSLKHQNNLYKIELNPLPDGEYYGFTIGGNQRFLLEDFTVTHNTTFCINLAMNMISVGAEKPANVFYYPCEITQELAMMRALLNLTGLSEEYLYDNPEKFKQRVREQLSQYVQGEIVWKGFPAGGARIQDIRNHAMTYQRTFGVKPDIIMIDYAETVQASEASKDRKDHRQQADVYTEARALGAEFQCPVVMPDRCNKETVNQAVPNMTSFQGAFQKAGIVDVSFGLCATEEEMLQNIMRYFIFLNRHGKAFQHFKGKVDAEKYSMSIDEEIEYEPDDGSDKDEKPRRGKGGSNGFRRRANLPEDLLNEDEISDEEDRPSSRSRRGR